MTAWQSIRAWSSTLAGGIARFFRAVFLPTPRDPFADTDETFEPIDVEEVARRFRIVEKAVRFGNEGLPETSATTLDGPQLRLQQFIEDEVAVAFRRANTKLTKLRSALEARAVDPLVGRAEQLPDEVERAISQRTQDATAKAQQYSAKREALLEELERYRKRYDLKRSPRLKEPHERRTLLFGTIVLGLAQAVANTVFFGQGMEYGLSAGLVFAAVLGFADVGLHAFAGRGAAAVQAPDLAHRLGGAALLVVVVLSVPAYNLGLVHLRNGVRQLGWAEGTEQWLTSYLGDPVGFSDFSSFALLIIGVVCSCMAVATGWNWDEPIPALRQMGRKLEEIEQDLRFWEEERAMAGYAERADAEEELERINKRVDNNLTMVSSLASRIRLLTENVGTFVQEAERAYVTLVRMYRDENTLARGTPPPAYFDDSPKLGLSAPLKFEIDEVESFVTRQKALRDRLNNNLRSLHRRISATADQP